MQNPADDSPARTNNYGLKDVQVILYLKSNKTCASQSIIHHNSNGNQVGSMSIRAGVTSSGGVQYVEFFSEQRGDDSNGVQRHHNFSRIVRLF